MLSHTKDTSVCFNNFLGIFVQDAYGKFYELMLQLFT